MFNECSSYTRLEEILQLIKSLEEILAPIAPIMLALKGSQLKSFTSISVHIVIPVKHDYAFPVLMNYGQE